MNGNSISVQVSDTGGVTLNDVATVIKADIDLGEGTVHVIDKVLTPPAAVPVPAVTTTSAPTKKVTTVKPTTMKPVTTEQNTHEFINPNLKPGEPVPRSTESDIVGVSLKRIVLPRFDLKSPPEAASAWICVSAMPPQALHHLMNVRLNKHVLLLNVLVMPVKDTRPIATLQHEKRMVTGSSECVNYVRWKLRLLIHPRR